MIFRVLCLSCPFQGVPFPTRTLRAFFIGNRQLTIENRQSKIENRKSSSCVSKILFPDGRDFQHGCFILFYCANGNA